MMKAKKAKRKAQKEKQREGLNIFFSFSFLFFQKTITRSSKEINYFPSIIDKTVREADPYPHESEVLEGKKERESAPVFDEYIQAGNRWRSFDPERQQRFADRVALTLSGDKVTQELLDIWLSHWNKVDPQLAKMILEYLLSPLSQKIPQV